MTPNKMSMQSGDFKIEITVHDESVQVVIDDRLRNVTDLITGVSVISVYHNDDSIRVGTDYNIRVV